MVASRGQVRQSSLDVAWGNDLGGPHGTKATGDQSLEIKAARCGVPLLGQFQPRIPRVP